jgi:hypothetical protein
MKNKPTDQLNFYTPGIPSVTEKLETYEKLLHDIQMFMVVTMDETKVRKALDNICAWSYAHRVGNGEYSEEEQDQIIAAAFKKLREY